MSNVVHKVVLIGDSSVGKTSIINQYIYKSVNAEHQPTVGIDFFAKTLKLDGKTVRLQIWDTAGQEKFHSLIPSYIRSSTVAIFVFDITSRLSFDNLDKWHKMVTDIANPTLVFVGNKVDLEEERDVKTEEGQKFAETHCAQYIETSARAPTNIDELFNIIAKMNVEGNNPSAPTEPAKPEPVIKGNQLKEGGADSPAPSGSCC